MTEDEIRADERAKILEELRWLAEGRKQYCHLVHKTGERKDNDTIKSYLGAQPHEQLLHQEHTVAEFMADVLEGKADAWGWLPSWLWDDYTEKFGKPSYTEWQKESEDAGA